LSKYGRCINILYYQVNLLFIC